MESEKSERRMKASKQMIELAKNNLPTLKGDKVMYRTPKRRYALFMDAHAESRNILKIGLYIPKEVEAGIYDPKAVITIDTAKKRYGTVVMDAPGIRFSKAMISNLELGQTYNYMYTSEEKEWIMPVQKKTDKSISGWDRRRKKCLLDDK